MASGHAENLLRGGGSLSPQAALPNIPKQRQQDLLLRLSIMQEQIRNLEHDLSENEKKQLRASGKEKGSQGEKMQFLGANKGINTFWGFLGARPHSDSFADTSRWGR